MSEKFKMGVFVGATFVACDRDYKKQEIIEIGEKHKLKALYVRPKEKVKIVVSTLNTV